MGKVDSDLDEKEVIDDPVLDQHWLMRRVHKDQWDWQKNQPKSAAIDKRFDMSLCLEHKPSLGDYHAMYPNHGIIKFTAGQLRAEGEQVVKEPSGDQCSFCHVNAKKKRSQAYRRKLARELARIEIVPPK